MWSNEELECFKVLYAFASASERRGNMEAVERYKHAITCLARHLVTVDEAYAMAGVTVTVV